MMTLYFTHKRCDHEFQRAHPGHWAWADLSKFQEPRKAVL